MMADPQYDAYRETVETRNPFDAAREYSETHTTCPACSLTFLFADAEECDNCGTWLHVECRHQCERCSDWFCPGCNPSGTCQGCRDVERYREYSAI